MRQVTKDEEERVRFAVFAIEAAAAKSGVPAWELYARLERLDLVRRRLAGKNCGKIRDDDVVAFGKMSYFCE